MEVRPGYKQSEVGVIPEDWDARAIGNDIDLLTGFPFLSSGYSESGVRLLRGSNVKRGKTDWADDITQYWPIVTQDVARYELRERDLVIAMDGSLVGRSSAQLAAEDLPALLLQRVARIRSTKKLDVSYLAAFVGGDWFVKHSDSVKTVTAIPHISPADIRSFTIPVPPKIEEQRAIATALSDVDALLAKLDQFIAKKRDLKQAAMQQLLTGQTRLPGFSGEWEVKRLGDITSPRKERVDPRKVGVQAFCIELEHIEQGKGCLVGSCSTGDGSSLKSVFHAEDVLFGKLRAYLRKYWLADRSGVCSTEIWVLVANRNLISPAFLFQIVKLDSFIETASSAYGTHMPRSDWNVVKNYEVAIPKLDEQTAIATALSDMDAELAALETRRDKAHALKQGMMQELLTGRIRLV